MMAAGRLLRSGAEQLGLDLPPATVERLVLYFRELGKWNRKMNLVGAAPEEALIDRHFLDSLTLLPILLQQQPADLLDIGSGAGFPGLVLKAAFPELAVTLVEPRRKRAAFLRHVSRTLALREVEIIEESLGAAAKPLPRPAYHLVTSRALSDMTAFLALAAPYCTPGGLVICMKGSRGPAELQEWQSLNDETFRLTETQEWQLPFSGARRLVYVFRKN
jgi:16S rRNA (guanine527-N7)-methyltransferase